MATVKHLDNGRTMVLWRDGTRKQHSATFDLERTPHGWLRFRAALEAEGHPAAPAGWLKQGTRWRFLPELAAAPQGPSEASAGQSLADYGTAYIGGKRFRGSDYYRMRSLASWSRHVASSAIGSIPVGTVTAGQLDAWQSELEGQLAPRTVRNLRTILHQVLNGAIQSELRRDNPLLAVKALGGGRQHHSAPVQKAQLPSFEAAAAQVDLEVPAGDPSWFQDAFTVLMRTGLRMGELRALQGCHIHGDLVIVAQAVKRAVIDGRECGQHAGSPKTVASSRTLVVDADTAALLATRAAAAGPAGYLWPSQRGGIVQASVMGHRWHHMLGLLRAAGVPIPADHITPAGRTVAGINPHGLRRTFVSLMQSAGVDVASVAAAVGHADKSTTLNIYTESMSDLADQRAAAATYAASLKANQERHLQAV